MLSTSEILKRHGITASKKLGQNFILDDNVTSKIVRLAGIESSDVVIEIGPGPGSLTRNLLTVSGKVIVIEKDKRFIEILHELGKPFPDKLQIIEADALKVDYSALRTANCELRTTVVANLPYNISTPILILLLREIRLFKTMTLMFQKEVADRIKAPPGSKDYGRLSVMASWLCDIERLMTLPPDVFTPKPKIHSTVLKFTPKANPIAADFGKMELVLRHAFGQRRKMLKSSLKPLISETALLDLGIPPDCRPEALGFAEFCAIANYL